VKDPTFANPDAGHNPTMTSQDSLDRLQTMVLVCQQLPAETTDTLLMLAIDSPERYTSELISLQSSGRLRLPDHLIDLLHRDLGALPVAV
jgi:hypothetical protein